MANQGGAKLRASDRLSVIKMSAAHRSCTIITRIFQLTPESERHVSGNVKENMQTSAETRKSIESRLSRGKQEAQVGRRKTRHKLSLRGTPLVEPIWTCTNIILYFMIILTLFSSSAHPESLKKSILADSSTNNNNESKQVILRSKSNLASLFGLSDESKKNCCLPKRPLKTDGQFMNFSIENINSNYVGEIKVTAGNRASGGDKGGQEVKKRGIEFRSRRRSEEMQNKRKGLSTETWLNRVLVPSIRKQEKRSPNVREVQILGSRLEEEGEGEGEEEEEEDATSRKLKRSLIQVEKDEPTLSVKKQIRQVLITEKGGTFTFTSTSTSTSSPSSALPTSNKYNKPPNSTQWNNELAAANNNNSSTNFSLPDQNFTNGNNNTQVTLTKQQQIQQQAFLRRLMELKQKYMTNRAISDRAYYILLIIYSLFIIVGTISNSLICLTVILKPKILSPRNIFIVNLAGSDLLLCVFTMPFSFIEISMKMWQMGLIPCKLVAGLQATSIFVSTISITAIALDRYKVIVYPTHRESTNGTRSAALLLASVWIGALILSLPLFRFRTVEHLDLPHKYDTIKSIDFCIEAWPFAHGRGIYSVVSMIFQYVLPITIVSVVYAKISDKLQKRLIRRQRLTQLECRQKKQLNLIRRTHTMLISVSLIFGLSWLPLNLLNVLGDFSDLFRGDDQLFRIVFAICHLIGCSSACTNPILYGYLNENFRKEFHQVYTHHMHALVRLCRRLTGRSKSGDDEEYDDDDEEEEEEEEEEEVEDEDDDDEDDDDDDDDYDEDEDEDDDCDESGEQDDEFDEDEDEDDDDRQFYIENSRNHQPITPASTIDSSAFASDEFECKGNRHQLSRQHENNKVNMKTNYFNGKQHPPNSPLSATSASHTPLDRAQTLSSTASEDVQRKCSLPLPDIFKAGESRNSSASLKVDQVNNIVDYRHRNSSPKVATSCILELAQNCANLRRGRKFLKTINQVENSTNDTFETPEFKLFPPSSATETPPISAGANRDVITIDVESNSSRRYSFQTLSNSRQTLGKTMRFCLCISNESLVESDAACGGASSGAGNSRSISKSPRRRRMRNNTGNKVQLIGKSKVVGGELADKSSPGPLVLQLNKRNSRRKRHRRRVVSPASCSCSCHKSVKIESPNSEVNINEDRRRSWNLLQVAKQRQLEEQKRNAGVVNGHSNKDVVGFKGRQGRRVWLRFFPDKQQERYIDCATFNTTATNKQCNDDKLTAIKSQNQNQQQQLEQMESIASDIGSNRREQSIKNNNKNEEVEEVGGQEEGGGDRGKDEAEQEEGQEGEVEVGDKERVVEEYVDDNNSNALREQTKPLNASAKPQIITGKQKNKQHQQLEEQVVRGRKQHCASCKQGSCKSDLKNKRRTRARGALRKEARSSSRRFRPKENVERKVKESGANSGGLVLRNETICGGSMKSRALSNTKSSPCSTPTGCSGSKNDYLKKGAIQEGSRRDEGSGGSKIEGLKVKVDDSMSGCTKIASYYYLSVETARSRAGSDVSKEQSTELVVINGDIDVAELEARAKDTASFLTTSSCRRNSPSLFKPSFEIENEQQQQQKQQQQQQQQQHKFGEMSERKFIQSSIDIRSTEQDKINNMQNLLLSSSNKTSNNNNNNNNNKSNNMDKNNHPSGIYNGRLRMQITASEPSIALGQQADTSSFVGANANVANSRESSEDVAKISCEPGSQMNYDQVKKGVGKEMEEVVGFFGNHIEPLKRIGLSFKHDSSARSTKPNVPVKPLSNNNGRTSFPTEIPTMVDGTFSLSILPDTLMTERPDARSNHRQQRAVSQNIDTNAKSNNNKQENVFDEPRVGNNGAGKLARRDLVDAERKRAADNTCTDSRKQRQQQLVRMSDPLTNTSMNYPTTLLQSDSNSSSCACLHSQSSSCTCSISSACRREVTILPKEAITSSCVAGGSGCCTTSITNTTTTINTTTTARNCKLNSGNSACVSINIIKNGANNEPATINLERALTSSPSSPSPSSIVKTSTNAATAILDTSKWRPSCADSSSQVHGGREATSNKLKMVSSSLNALPSVAAAAAAASAIQSLSMNAKTNALMNTCHIFSASTSCSGSGSGSVLSASNDAISSSIVETASSITTNNCISRSSLASNDGEFTCSSSVACVPVARRPLDSFASSSASLEVARVMASAPAFSLAPRCPALSRMTKQARRLSISSLGTSNDLLLKANELDRNISPQLLAKQCNGCSASIQSEFNTTMLVSTTRDGEKLVCDLDKGTQNSTTGDLAKEQTLRDQVRPTNSCILSDDNSCNNNSSSITVSNSTDSALWQRFGGNDVLTRSQENIILAEKGRFS